MSTTGRATRGRDPKPPWLRVRAPGGESYAHLKTVLRERGLYTVCEEARCPNVHECWSGRDRDGHAPGRASARAAAGSARSRPASSPRRPTRSTSPSTRPTPMRASSACDYVVLTMVDRDDLEDEAAADHVAA